MTLSNKCKNCQHKTWACPGWMCGNEKHPMFDPDGDAPIMVAPNDSCELYEEGKNKIYVAIFNYVGDYNNLKCLRSLSKMPSLRSLLISAESPLRSTSK